MADIALRIKADFEQAQKAFQKTGYNSDELSAKIEKLKKSFSPEQIENFQKKINLNASALTATRGATEALTYKTREYQKEIERLIRAGLNPENEELKKLQAQYIALNVQTESLKNKHKQLADSMMASGRSMTMYMTLPLIAAGGASFKLASDYNESVNKINVSLGESGRGMTEWAKTTYKSVGLSSGTALEMASNFADMGTSMDIPRQKAASMSMSLVELAGNLNSYKNVKVDIANTALSAIFNGETESLKKLAVVQTVENLNLFALRNSYKKTFDQMNQAEKVMLRYAFVTYSLRNATNDFKNTQAEAANQMRMFTEGSKELGINFGQIMLPAIVKVINFGNKFLSTIMAMDENTKSTILTIVGFAAVLGPLLVVGGAVLNMIGAYTAATAALEIMTMAQAAAQGKSSIALIANKIAMTISTAATWLLTKAVTALNVAMSVGPMAAITFAVAAAGIAYFALSGKTKELTEETDKLTDAQIRYQSAMAGQYKMAPESRKALNDWLDTNRKKGSSEDELIAKLREGAAEKQKLSESTYAKPSKGEQYWMEKNSKIAAMWTQRAKELEDEKTKNAEANSKKRLNINSKELSDLARDNKKYDEEYKKLVEESGLNEIQLSQLKYSQELELLEENLARGIVKYKDYYNILMALSKKHGSEIENSEKSYFQKKIDEYKNTYQAISDQVTSVLSSISSYLQAANQADIAMLDEKMRKELQRANALDQTTKQQAQAEYDAAIATGNALDIEEKRRALAKATIEEKYAQKRKKLEYEGALSAWKFQVAIAAAAVPLTILNALSAGAKWGIPGMVAFGVAASLAAGTQFAAVAAAKPVKQAQTGLQDYEVPYSRDNSRDGFPVRATSGERVTVTPRGESNDKQMNINIQIQDETLIRVIQRYIDTGKIRVTDKNIGRGVFAA